MLAHETLLQLKTAIDFQPTGEPAGNLTLGRGRHGANAVHVALVENKVASGALGSIESDRLASLFKVVAGKKAPLVMYLDSAGAKVSEGLPALGAFRHMYRAALAMAYSGAPTAVFCGANCFGGASMLASLAGTRLYSRNTRLAMSGPAILAQSAGASVLDESFQAVSQAAIGAEARARLSPGNVAVTGALLREPWAAAAADDAHAELGRRLGEAGNRDAAAGTARVERQDFDKLYPGGTMLKEAGGVLTGKAMREGETVPVLGLIDGRALGAARAWLLADTVRSMRGAPPKTLHLLIDCETHSTALDDERLMLSAYLANLASALFALAAAGTHIETTVLGKLGGGVYVALCAPAAKVNLVYGAEIQLLPGRAIASILGDAGAQSFDFAEYRAARVADCELKLGIV